MNKKYFPPHIYLENTIYFITSHTFDKNPFIDTAEKKELLVKVLFEKIKKFSFELYGWVIHSAHYHLLFNIKQENNLAKFIQNVHGKSALLVNKIDNSPGRRIWANYWDRCIRSEKDFYTRLNYIHHNPVKHNVSKSMNDYPYSSYTFYKAKYGERWLEDCFRIYPIKDFTIECPD